MLPVRESPAGHLISDIKYVCFHAFVPTRGLERDVPSYGPFGANPPAGLFFHNSALIITYRRSKKGEKDKKNLD
jgi:hypothetical protein